MRVLLITTGLNCVREALAAREDIALEVVDVNDCTEVDKAAFLYSLKELVWKRELQLLITWRCPYVLSDEIFSVPEYGAYNLHPSLLPAYPGLNPWDALYADRVTMTGVTLHKMTKHVDIGDIIIQQEFSILGLSYAEARKKSDMIAALMISDFLKTFND